MPIPAAKSSVPSHSRCATHGGHMEHAFHDPEVRAHREQVADVLVADGAEADVRVPHRGRAREEARRDRGRGTTSCPTRPCPASMSSSGT